MAIIFFIFQHKYTTTRRKGFECLNPGDNNVYLIIFQHEYVAVTGDIDPNDLGE